MGTLIKNAKIINENKIFEGDILIENQFISKIASSISVNNHDLIDINGNFLIPGVIDDQVHFREPGLTHKANIFSESRAAIAGGITSYMEMPNTIPQTLTQNLLAEKIDIGKKTSLANFSFFFGASNENLEEVLKVDFKYTPGVKIFMGSSTGNMLVDNYSVLNSIFSKCSSLIATHCEDEEIIKQNLKLAQNKYGDNIPINEHPKIRSREACYKSSSLAIELAKKHNSRLHILHISTAEELDLFTNKVPLKSKRITSEACIHHLTFKNDDYDKLGSLIKWNPAVKNLSDQNAIWDALLDDRIDVIATDHAPHTKHEKNNSYLSCPSGGPLVQHALPMMLQHMKNGRISIEKVVEKMCHAPADCFKISKRGYIREGYFADLVSFKEKKWTVSNENILYHCKWSPFINKNFDYQISHTIVNGNLCYHNGSFNESKMGLLIEFNNH
ncbi:MAG: dihydroorotase [Flavobacteriales bacterium TMED113]|nr:MAG: dihydroorotase [Flavobacteriales bacterium TMED113]